jgi:hypothetical protein
MIRRVTLEIAKVLVYLEPASIKRTLTLEVSLRRFANALPAAPPAKPFTSDAIV